MRAPYIRYWLTHILRHITWSVCMHRRPRKWMASAKHGKCEKEGQHRRLRSCYELPKQSDSIRKTCLLTTNMVVWYFDWFIKALKRKIDFSAVRGVDMPQHETTPLGPLGSGGTTGDVSMFFFTRLFVSVTKLKNVEHVDGSTSRRFFSS